MALKAMGVVAAPWLQLTQRVCLGEMNTKLSTATAVQRHRNVHTYA